jgi:hypothetical protein
MNRFQILLIVTLFVAACGGLQEVWMGPDAEGFHPKSIAVLPPIVGQHEGARDPSMEVVLAALNQTHFFETVVPSEQVVSAFETKEASDLLAGYYAKLETTGQSDRDLAVKMGELLKTEALLVVRVNAWEYARSDGDNIAKVGLGLRMVDALKGGLIWKARHETTEGYLFIKPDLHDVGEELASEMLQEMPH